MDDRELRSLLTLTLVPGIGSTLTRRCVEAMGSAAVLDALGETGRTLRAAMTADPQTSDAAPAARNLTDTQNRIVASLDEPRGLDQIAVETGLAVHTIQSDLTMLEIRGLIQKSGASFRAVSSGLKPS